MHQYKCQNCGASLDPGERCDCQQVDISPKEIPETITERLARPLIEIVAKAFEDPKVAKEYRQWKKQREASHATR